MGASFFAGETGTVSFVVCRCYTTSGQVITSRANEELVGVAATGPDRCVQESWVTVKARHSVCRVNDFETIVLTLQTNIFTETRSAKGRAGRAGVVLVVKASSAADCSRAEAVHESLSSCTRAPTGRQCE